MGWWTDQVVSRVGSRLMDDPALHDVRARTCAGLIGEVLEVGFGSGLNTVFYPPTVTAVAAVEPADVSWRLAAERVAASPAPVRRAARDAQQLPLDDASADSALSTFTLCTIPDPARALAEVHRVLRPGAVFHLVEHGRAPEPGVQRWQDRLTPVSRVVQGGCHLNRPIDELLVAAGFTAELERWYLPGPRPFVAVYEGVAVRR